MSMRLTVCSYYVTRQSQTADSAPGAVPWEVILSAQKVVRVSVGLQLANCNRRIHGHLIAGQLIAGQLIAWTHNRSDN